MIRIEEKPCVKFPGVSSLFISFKYTAQTGANIVSVIKQSDKYCYHEFRKEWEVPITSLAYFLDELTYLDDITLKLIECEDSGEHLIPRCTYKTKPFDYQMEGIEFGLNHEHFLLLDQPGLGKTLQMICLAQELKEQKGIEHCLVICGINSLKANWKKEIEKHSDLTCRILGEKINSKGKVSYATVAERAEELYQPLDAFFIIVNIESFRNKDFIKALTRSKNKIDMAVFDEAHKAKGWNSEQGSNLLKTKDLFKYKVALTGTLLMNNPLDAYVPLRWVGVGNDKSGVTEYKSQYCIYGGFGGHQIVGYKNMDILKAQIEQFSLRRLKSEVAPQLPPKTIIEEIIEMNESHRKFYENVKKGIKEELMTVNLIPGNILSLTTRLRQATSCPSVLTDDSSVESTKIERAVELVEELVAEGNKVVIMSTFKEPIYRLGELLKTYNPLINTGDQEGASLSKNVDLFQSNDSYKVFLGTTAKCGTGLTLNAATYMIMLDTPWTSALTEQCEDRIHRITNTEPVFIYRLICKNTIDEKVESLIKTKKAVSDYIVDDIADDTTIDILRDYITDL